MKFFKHYIAYLKDNPEGYWFKRKLYGYGWTPATREGWAATIAVLGYIIFKAVSFEVGDFPEEEALMLVLMPSFAAVGALVLLCIFKGETPKWSWGQEKEYPEVEAKHETST